MLCGREPELESVRTHSDGAGVCKWAQPLGKLLGSSIKVKINMPGDSAIPLLGIYQKRKTQQNNVTLI